MADRAASDFRDRAAFKALWTGIAVFLILSIPFLFWPFNQHPDERLYTVAAAEMIASGDYLVPKSETGDLRLKKPLIPYYYVVAGFQVFGLANIQNFAFFVIILVHPWTLRKCTYL